MHIRLSNMIFCALALAFANPANAQRTDNNAVTSADDAFGKTVVGDEQIGIYNPDDVRGFSPVSAGNLRLEGLFFDQQSYLTDRLIDGSTIHVGISAQGYPFPAPTGIADYSLRKPGDKFVASIGLNYGPWYGKSAELDVQVPITGRRQNHTQFRFATNQGRHSASSHSGARSTFAKMKASRSSSRVEISCRPAFRAVGSLVRNGRIPKQS